MSHFAILFAFCQARMIEKQWTIPDFLSPNAPRNRLAILRGLEKNELARLEE